MGPEDAVLLDYADRDDDGVTLLDLHDSGWDQAIIIESYYMSDEAVKDRRTLSRPTVGTPRGSLARTRREHRRGGGLSSVTAQGLTVVVPTNGRVQIP